MGIPKIYESDQKVLWKLGSGKVEGYKGQAKSVMFRLSLINSQKEYNLLLQRVDI